MLRGTVLFKCTECKNIFKGPDFEWRATIYSAPCKCPQCGSYRTMPRWAIFQKSAYKAIWKSLEESEKQQL